MKRLRRLSRTDDHHLAGVKPIAAASGQQKMIGICL